MEKLLTFQGSLNYNQLKEVVANTPPDISNRDFFKVLETVAKVEPKTTIEVKPKIEPEQPKASQVSPKEQQRLDNLAAKRARHNENISLFKGFGGRCRY